MRAPQKRKMPETARPADPSYHMKLDLPREGVILADNETKRQSKKTSLGRSCFLTGAEIRRY
jgi:hypothetical protein